MTMVRLIARLDVKMSWLIKGVQMDGWRKVGRPGDKAKIYYDRGIDEIILMDVVASLYQRNTLRDIVRETAAEVFIPMTVGGGVGSVSDTSDLLSSGADKIAINTAATTRPELITEISAQFGSQAVVVSIEAIRKPHGGYEALTDNGRNHTGLEVVDWAERAEGLGAGELLITCINVEGTGKGPELELLREICRRVNIPVVAAGGFQTPAHLVAAAEAGVSGIALAQALHYDRLDLGTAREALTEAGFSTRQQPNVNEGRQPVITS